MKRILLSSATLGLLGLLLLTATPGPDHKVDWCHYPPGQWNGFPAPASKVLILSIDVAAIPGHLGHSPSLAGGTCNTATGAGCAEGIYTNGSCPTGGSAPCTPFTVLASVAGGGLVNVGPDPAPGKDPTVCVCLNVVGGGPSARYGLPPDPAFNPTPCGDSL